MAHKHYLLHSIATEGVEHTTSSKLGKLIEEELTKLRVYDRVTQNMIDNSNLSSGIRKLTGMDFRFLVEDMINAYVYPPELDKNNVMINNARRWMYDNHDSERILKEKEFFEGTVDLERIRVTGDFCKLPMTLGIGEPMIWKRSDFTVPEITAIILHEIGHAFVYMQMSYRLTKTNYLLMEGSKRLMDAETKEIRLKLITEIEEGLGAQIKDKEQLAEDKRNPVTYQTIFLHAAAKESESNLGYSIYDTRAFEQLADNFASRQGYQRPLATGLDKMHRLFGDKAYRHPLWNTILNILDVIIVVNSILITILYAMASWDPRAWFWLFSVVMFVVAVGNPLAMTYDPIDVRITKLRQQVNDALKDRTLSVQQQKQYLEDAKVIEDVLSKMYHGNSGAYEFVWKVLFPPNWKNVRDVNMQLKLEELMNNDLYSAAAGLQVASN